MLFRSENLIALCSYLTHHSSPPSIRDGDDSIKLLGGILALAKKYDALEMHALAAHLLETRWPSDHSLWETDRKSRSLHLDAGTFLCMMI